MLACDFRVVSETCLYALPEQRLGQIPGSGGAARLQKMVGITRAKDIVMRPRRLGGRQAYEWGGATECLSPTASSRPQPTRSSTSCEFSLRPAHRQETVERH